jgi:hypothetical protein
VTARLALKSAPVHVRDPRTRPLFRRRVVAIPHFPLRFAMENAP